MKAIALEEGENMEDKTISGENRGGGGNQKSVLARKPREDHKGRSGQMFQKSQKRKDLRNS